MIKIEFVSCDGLGKNIDQRYHKFILNEVKNEIIEKNNKNQNEIKEKFHTEKIKR